MDFYKDMHITVRADGITSFIWRHEGAPYGRSHYAKTSEWLAFLRPLSRDNDCTVLQDGYHILTRMMETWTFVDIDGVNYRAIECEGKTELRVCVMTVPYKVQEWLVDRIEDAVAKLAKRKEGDDEKIRIEFSQEDRKRWLGHFGIGKGAARFEYTSEEQQQRFEACLAKYANRDDDEAKSFRRCVENLTNIAKNTTRSVEETGTVRIGYDWAGFTFTAGGMFGGMIHHRADDEGNGGDWSLHT